jgi:hypothetical protein
MSSLSSPPALVVTSINPPNPVMKSLAEGCQAHGWNFFIAGDSKSPSMYELDGATFLSLEAQVHEGYSLARAAPIRTYTRKNIAYLHAMRAGAEVIVETDDDNFPMDAFWNPRVRSVLASGIQENAWVNAYRYFTDDFIYPRGLPLNHARGLLPSRGAVQHYDCHIQQGLADVDPDVDAVYRMLYSLPFHFQKGIDPVLLLGQAWCPFNSQNTTFFADAFPLLYLPAKCSFRMTDIWRSFVAQRILHSLSSGVLFHEATVWQERNEHDLHKDFIDEIPGYQNNAAMRVALMETDLEDSLSVRMKMEKCYQTLIRNGWVGAEEEALLGHWFQDLSDLHVI